MKSEALNRDSQTKFSWKIQACLKKLRILLNHRLITWMHNIREILWHLKRKKQPIHYNWPDKKCYRYNLWKTFCKFIKAHLFLGLLLKTAHTESSMDPALKPWQLRNAPIETYLSLLKQFKTCKSCRLTCWEEAKLWRSLFNKQDWLCLLKREDNF